jgi:phospholipid/cholesterol/gamma-HCH transport system substrate-binding protein
LAGQRVGQISSIDFIPITRKRGGNNLVIHFSVAEDVRDQIRTDSKVTLRSQGLLGDRFLDIEPGTPGAAIMRAGDTLVATQPLDMDQLLATAARTLDEAHLLVSELRTTTTAINRGEGTLGLLLNDQVLYGRMAGATAELHTTLQNINRSDGTFARLIRDPQLYRQLSSGVARVDSLGVALLHGGGTFNRLLYSDSLYRGFMGVVTGAQGMVGRADTALVGLGAFLGRLGNGEGAIQRALADPALYDQFLKAVVDLQTLLNDIRANPRRYRPEMNVDIF